MVEDTIGLNAGKVWTSLHSSGSLTKNQILRQTHLTENEFDQAIGWLARENKIKKVGEFFSLDETNLTESIGEKAGMLFDILQQLQQDVSVLHKLTEFSKEDIHQSIGWLSREGNIPVSQGPPIDEMNETKLTMQYLQEEIHSLHDDIQNRNHIIQDLTNQLTVKQMMFITRTDVVEKLNTQLVTSHELTERSEEELSDKQLRIEHLTEEIHLLHDEIISRNQIIHDLTHQLTEKQTQFIERSDALDRLQTAICNKKPESMSSVTSMIHERVQSVSSLQEALENKQQHIIVNNVDKSTLLDKNTPIITLDEEQHKDLCEELNNVIKENKQPFHHMMNNETDMESEDHKKTMDKNLKTD